MSANDPDDFIKQEIDWIGVPLREKKPFLGLCLGAQMLAKHLGAAVWEHPGRPRRDRLLPARADRGRRGASPSAGARPGRATSTTGTGRVSTARPAPRPSPPATISRPRRSASAPRAFGLQFHPEVTHAMICRWTVRAAERLALPGAQDRARQIEGRFMHDPHVARWLDAFLDDWLGSEPADVERTKARPAPAARRSGSE